MRLSGRLFGVGVGPGDPELLTLKAARVIGAAPVIAYLAADDRPSTARGIAAAAIPASATEIAIRVPMRPGEAPGAIYDAAAAEIAAHLDGGRDVAVLCEGDPFFYGSFIYLHERLGGRYPTSVVPGITSLTACAAAALAPLVRRDQALAVLPATLPEAELEARLGEGAAAILKVGRHLGRLRALLARRGALGRAVLVAHASRTDEAVTPLGRSTEETAPYFSMILVAAPETS